MTRTEQLAQKRIDLSARCALQRQQVAQLTRHIETRLGTADRVINVVSSITQSPLVMIAATAATFFLGPWRVMRWVGQGMVLFKVARKLQQLITSR